MASLEEVMAQQEEIMRTIERALPNFKKMGVAKMTPAVTRNRMSMLKDLYRQSQELNAKLVTLADPKSKGTHRYFVERLFERSEELYSEALDYMAEILERYTGARATEPAADTGNLQAARLRSLSLLPHIKLPSFDGTFDHWESFRDKFSSMIINDKSLSNVDRLHFLCSALTGDALETVNHLEITDANFELAWQTVTHTYEKKRRLVLTHVNNLFSLPPVTSESAKELRNLRDKLNTSIHALKKLKRPVEHWDDILVCLGTQRLDRNTRKAWELQFDNASELPTYADFENFLEHRVDALESLFASKQSKPAIEALKPKLKTISANNSVASPIICPVCPQNHLLYQCQSFLSLEPPERFKIIKAQRRCVNCFSAKHAKEQCQSQRRCKVCKQQHHTLLHFPAKPTQSNVSGQLNTTQPPNVSQSTQQSAPPSEVEPEISSNSASRTQPNVGILLSTARIRVYSTQGRHVQVRALLDQGSVATLISENLAQLLRLNRTKQPTCITGIGGTRSWAHHTARIIITPSVRSEPVFSTTAIILKTLTRYIPNKHDSSTNWRHISGLELADPEPMSSDPIDVVIGADLFGQLLLDGIRKGSTTEPIAQSTHLGWILSGPTSATPLPFFVDAHHTALFENLDQELRRFWEVETVPTQVLLSPEEEKCELHFQSSHYRTPEGRYVVRLPFKSERPIEIGDSRLSAMKSLISLERRFQNDPTNSDKYKQFLSEYESLGHMQRIQSSLDQTTHQRYYIPHHAVVRESSSTTRLRVVFNASRRTTNGTSLNDHLLTGPKLQVDLIALLLRWRTFQFVYTADIAKMYRQILVDPRDTDFQRILWRDSPQSPVMEYKLLTVTYGVTSAPYQALRVLKQLTLDEGHRYPLAVSVLQTQTYVDDCLFGADDKILLKRTRDETIALLETGGFRLRKWASNDHTLLEDIDPQDHGLANTKSVPTDETCAVLGLDWNPTRDQFSFRIAVSPDLANTKRTVLSNIAKLFDPMGILTPVIITAKIFMQQLWSVRAEWDEALPDHLLREWVKYYNQLPNLATITIPRRLLFDTALSQEIHGFADASTKAYAACVYLRSVHLDGNISVSLLFAKSRVAPIKTVSIPRLELCAAVLLSKSIAFVKQSLTSLSCPIYCWTDSNIVIAWLSQPPTRWKTFVANRVSHIQTLLPEAQWHHVPTEFNPADCATRGLTPCELKDYSLWWTGPPWLTGSPELWPKNQPQTTTAPEERTLSVVSAVSTIEKWDLSTRYSSWPKLLRVTAYILRFILNLRQRDDHNQSHVLTNKSLEAVTPLRPAEIQRAKVLWLRRIQAESFPDEISLLSETKRLPNSSPRLSLNPFIDSDGLMRARGRLASSELPEKTKKPIILRSHPLLVLIINYTHLVHLHAGPQLTLACLRREYWILRARTTVRSVLYKCVPCTRHRASIPSELMGDLPAVRVNPAERPFINTGVDYAGPIQVRTAPGRGHKSHKAYIAVFVCMVTKAVHLDLVSDYTSAAFLAAYTRFVSRRGMPKSMYSDNGTTFQGASSELNQLLKQSLKNPNLLNRLAVDGVEWHFLPPSAPHFGGLWEAAVKSVKHHLRRSVGLYTLTFEELTTLLCRIEAALNSRPLVAMSDCLDDYSVLTPGHFLIGSAITTLPEPSVLHLKENRLSRWQLIQRITETFWRAWRNDYLHTLHQRPKWKTAQHLAKIGQLVLLRSENTSPSQWELARITACHPGSDGITRVVTLKTAKSTYKRPISKICFLPVDINNTTEADSLS